MKMNQEAREIIGRMIKEARKKKKLTQRELGEKLGKKEVTVRMWELGKNVPNPYVLEQLSDLLDINYSEIMTIAKDATQSSNKGMNIFDSLLEPSKQRAPITVQIPFQFNEVDSNGVTITKGARSPEELKKWVFDLHYLMRLDMDLFYKGEKLDLNQKKQIDLFIKVMLDKKE